MTWKEWKVKWDALTEEQRERIRHKAQWEHMSLMAVMKEWGIPGPSTKPEEGTK